MQAFMAGKVRVEGDMAKLMALQAAPAATDSTAAEMAGRIRDITE
jgi:putative sterol carrier protein